MGKKNEMPPEEEAATLRQMEDILTRMRQNSRNLNEETLEMQEEAIGAALNTILGPLIEAGENVTIITQRLLKLGVKELRFRLDKVLEKIPRIK
jgi:hypothetical protein